MLALASSEAAAAPAATSAALSSLPTAEASSAYAKAVSVNTTATAKSVAATVANAVATVTGSIVQATPASSVTLKLAPQIAKEAAWLHSNGWPLYALVDRYATGAPLDEQAHCMAVAVYHEARGESLEGQLAVARVIMNRAASGKYPSTWCGTVKQPWQFSFVNPKTGEYPAVNTSSAAWAKAEAITRLAVSNAVPSLDTDVLWYHATYVAPGWGKRLTRASKIGTHIFYR
jgi:spore germination cell wall hydrolase CwlJ-like protein